VAPYIRKSWQISGSRSVGIDRSRTQAMEFFFLVLQTEVNLPMSRQKSNVSPRRTTEETQRANTRTYLCPNWQTRGAYSHHVSQKGNFVVKQNETAYSSRICPWFLIPQHFLCRGSYFRRNYLSRLIRTHKYLDTEDSDP
jgi:hypothetical protein